MMVRGASIKEVPIANRKWITKNFGGLTSSLPSNFASLAVG